MSPGVCWDPFSTSSSPLPPHPSLCSPRLPTRSWQPAPELLRHPGHLGKLTSESLPIQSAWHTSGSPCPQCEWGGESKRRSPLELSGGAWLARSPLLSECLTLSKAPHPPQPSIFPFLTASWKLNVESWKAGFICCLLVLHPSSLCPFPPTIPCIQKGQAPPFLYTLLMNTFPPIFRGRTFFSLP